VGRRLCVLCHQTLEFRFRKYCKAHSSLASAIWKRVHRRLWKKAGDPYWLSDWKNRTIEERRTYFRNYMRRYRRRVAMEQLIAKLRGGSDVH